MAEGALLPLAGNVLELLSVVQESNLPFGDKIEIKILSDRVSKIQAVILDAEKKSSHDDRIKAWLRKLKFVLFDADDLLDGLSTEVLRRKLMTGNKMAKKVRLLFSNSNPLSFSLKKMGHELKAIRERLTVVEKDMHAFDFSESSIEPQVMIRDMETYSFVLEDEVIGRENDKKEIIERLFDDNVVENISIISIVGFGGLGKTTLAQLVYNDENVNKKFELKIWICVSDNFEVKWIVKEILEQLTKRKHEVNLEILINQLREELNGKKYLIVLDDVWNENRDIWLHLRNILTVGARGSKIIVTTRSKIVAMIMGENSCYALEGLPEEMAWSLFVKMAFEGGQLPEKEAFISLGKEFMRKCDGVPLTIRAIASLLSTKASENEWMYLSNELPKIFQENNVFSMLNFSCDDLPSYLKQCFAYCSLFPKDYKINVETLIHLWAAQGFIKLSKPKERVEDVGRVYFMVLLRRSFFQDVEKDELGNIVCCKMHDLMHDLAILKAGMEGAVLTSIEFGFGKVVRHLSVYLEDSLSQLPISMVKGMRLRTVLAASIGGQLGNLTCDALLSNLKYIRTLDLSKLKLHVVPHSIGKLKHLRYLDLSKNEDIEFLPKSITKLLNLQTLKLNGCDSLRELPQGIENLVNLRHLEITRCLKLTHMPLGLGYLTSLEILPMFVVRQEGVKVSSSGWYKEKQPRFGGGLSELKELSNLGGSLLIKYLGHGEDEILECKATNMNEKQHLQGLQLWWEESLEWDGEIECHDENSLEGLRPHPNLRALDLRYYMGMKIPSWVSSLTNLVTLRIMECPNLKGWWMNSDDDVNEPDLTSLQRLVIHECPNLTSLPFLISLQHLAITGCPFLQARHRRNTGVCWSYIAHVPHLYIEGDEQEIVSSETEELKGITSEQDESNEEDPFPSLFSEDNSSLLPIQGAGESSVPMSQTPNSRNEADVLTNTWSNQDGVQDLSFESIKVSEISELMDLPKRVHSLKIEGCDDLGFIPKGVMSSELSLQELYIINCFSLESFPKDHPPTALKILYIRNCKKLNFPLTTEKKTHQDALLEYLCIGSSCDSLKFLSLDLFPNLKSLSIWDCANLESLSMPVQKNLTSLEALEIRDCPNLVSFRGRGLFTMNLTSIWLSNCKKLEKLPELHTLDSLQSMFINNCPELVSLSEKGLPSRLSLLSITFCNKLKLKDKRVLNGLDFLRRLEIEGGCDDVESFPEKFLPRNLSSLRISRLSNLKNLDKKDFQQLTALQRLEISCCHNLRSLPEAGFPSSLSFLCIKECPLLTSKFRNKKGNDWSKIEHISCIEIDEEVIS